MKKNNLRTTLLIILILICMPLVYADSIPPPALGIEGTIYYFDGQTELFEGVEVLIENLDTSQVAIAKTGKGSPGRYSITLNWEENSEVKVSVRNPFYENSTTFLLEGSMRNVNLYLNMDIPNIAPNITSEPITDAFEETEYEYQVEAFDWNQDEISYDLIDSPSNMNISSQGLITWTPTRDQHGLHNITINVSDGFNDSYQSFQIEVFVEITPPNILSTPLSIAKKNELYTYVMQVEDEDIDYLTYKVFRGAPGMYFEDNTLFYTPLEDDSGTYIIILDVYNRFEERSRQIYFLTIQELEETKKEASQSSSRTGNLDVFERVTSNSIFNLSTTQISVNQIIIDSNKTLKLFVKKLNSQQTPIPIIQTRTYQFLEIKANETVTENVNILFTVPKAWMNSFNITTNDIVLSKYIGGSWVELQTTFILSTNDSHTFSSLSEGLSLFAITHKQNASISNPDIKINKFDTSIDFAGIIKLENVSNMFLNQVVKRLRIEFVNLNSEQTFNATTQLVNQNIFYNAKIIGNLNDIIQINVYFNEEQVLFEEFILTSPNLSKNLAINDDIIKSFIKTRIYLYIIGIVILVFTTIFITIKGRWLEIKK